MLSVGRLSLRERTRELTSEVRQALSLYRAALFRGAKGDQRGRSLRERALHQAER